MQYHDSCSIEKDDNTAWACNMDNQLEHATRTCTREKKAWICSINLKYRYETKTGLKMDGSSFRGAIN
jgi:hypothetical protein